MSASNAATVRQNRKQSVFVHVKPTDVLKKRQNDNNMQLRSNINK